MENIELPFKGRISEEVLFQEIEGEAVLLNLENEKYFGLNEIGTRFWHLLAETGDSERVMASLRVEFDVEAETLRKDLSVLINELVKHGLFIVETR